MPELSPQAQEVFWAFNKAASGKPDDWHYLPAIAAALEAAADQVVPEQQEPPQSPHMGNFISHARWIQRQALRHQILAIAAELKAQ